MRLWLTQFTQSLRKIFTMPMALSGALGLLLVGVIATFYEESLYRAQQSQELQVQGQILAASVTAALVFNDDAAAQEYVSAMQANPQLEAVGVYDQTGMRVAGFVRRNADPLPPAPAIASPYVSGNRITLVMQVEQTGMRLGEVYLRATMDTIFRRLVRYAGIFLLVVMGVLVLTVSSAAQRALANANLLLESQAHELARSNIKLQSEMQEREKAEEALRQSHKMEALGQLSGGFAHDFNNLLAIIKGNLQLLKRQLARGENMDGLRYVDGASEGVNRAATLTQRVLAFARRQPLSPKPVNLSQLLANMTDLLRHSVGSRIEIKMRLDANWTTLCDAHQMENVLINLAINARDAMPEGGELIFETANRPQGTLSGIGQGDYLELRVRDTGIGMSEEVRQKAVDPFFTTKPQGQGTGLGLSMTFGYVRQSGGDLRIDSEVGKGTTITILMPRYEPQTVAVSA